MTSRHMYALIIKSQVAMPTTASAVCRICKNVCVEMFAVLHRQSQRRE